MLYLCSRIAEIMKESGVTLQISDLTICYGSDPVLQSFSLTLHAGELVCITGASGCGKTSLLNAVMGFVPISSGSLSLCGKIYSEHSIDSIRHHIAWIPQELSLPAERVSELISLPFGLRANRSQTPGREQLTALFAELGLESDLYDKRVSEISGGQRQRIMLAVAIALNKKLMVIDEPTSALDSESVTRVLACLHRQACRGTAILAVSHDEQFAAGCDRVLPLSQ